MGYYLQAVLVGGSLAGGSQLPAAKVVSLRQGVAMIPLTDELFDEIQAALPDSGESFEGFEKLSGSVARWVRDLSAGGLAAYVEAEYFGGVGGQSAVAWREGQLAFEPVHTPDAINRALRLFGVGVDGERDEFDTVGLGLHRFTDDWL